MGDTEIICKENDICCDINENIKFVTSLSKYNNPVKQIVEEIVYIISKTVCKALNENKKSFCCSSPLLSSISSTVGIKNSEDKCNHNDNSDTTNYTFVEQLILIGISEFNVENNLNEILDIIESLQDEDSNKEPENLTIEDINNKKNDEILPLSVGGSNNENDKLKKNEENIKKNEEYCIDFFE